MELRNAYIWHKLLIAIFPFISCVSYAQINSQYNLDINNGMPDDHVYCLRADRHGYLWMGTPNGVVRYNGYKVKIYTYPDGLAKNDIWKIYEDSIGRLWLFSLSDQLGYIYNNKYKKVYNSSNRTLYPKEMSEYNNSICFLSPYINENKRSLCVVENDTILTKDFTNIGISLIGSKNNIYLKSDDTLIHCVFSFDRYKKIEINFKAPVILRRKNSILDHGLSFIYKDHFLTFHYNYPRFETIDLNNYSIHTYDLQTIGGQKDNILLTYEINGDLFILGNTYVYFFDSLMHLKSMYRSDSILNNETGRTNISYVLNDDHWGQCIATTSKGLFINFPNEELHFKKINQFSLAGYNYIGCISDTITYWWNNSTLTVAKLCNNRTILSHYYENGFDIKNIIPFNKDTSILFTSSTLYWLNNTTWHIEPLFSKTIPGYLGFKGVWYDSNSFFILSHGGLNFSKIRSPSSQKIITDRYDNILYDPFRNLLWVYNYNKILVYNKRTNSQDILGIDALGKMGIHNIEKITVDKYGNIFLKEYDRLLVYNSFDNSIHSLLNNYRMAGAKLEIKNDKVIVAGMFGIAFMSISGPSKFSVPVIYTNLKNSKYNRIQDWNVSEQDVLLQTDKGDYLVPIPTRHELEYNKKINLPFTQFIVIYKDTLRHIATNDTINVSQPDMKLQFDVINPSGNGALKYLYQIQGIDTEWHELNADELGLHQLAANKYYTLSVIAYDDAWRSNPVVIKLYIIPYWWQSPSGIRALWVSAIATALLMLLLVIWVTKRIVTKKNAKKNLQLELELKSIYSQINPHFIFNSLSSALLLINNKDMEEAYIHISKFSRLLRAYIKSSRNKFISIADEIENLKNYLDLQQTRFKKKFNYDIVADETLLADKEKIPSLLLQPLVENAINHGLLHKEGVGHLKILLKKGDIENEIICIIDDDGIGRKRSKLINDENQVKDASYGDQLIKDLISIFNKYENMFIEIKYTDKDLPLTGTIVAITIKNPHT